jgi:hypothetical protein
MKSISVKTKQELKFEEYKDMRFEFEQELTHIEKELPYLVMFTPVFPRGSVKSL